MDHITQNAEVDYTAEAAAFLTRHGWTGELLFSAVRMDENHRVFNPAITLGAIARTVTEQNEKERAPQVLGHLQQALTPQPSGRWAPLVNRRAAQIKREIEPRLRDAWAALYRDEARQPGRWLKALVERCDAEIKYLERQRAEDQAQLRQAEQDLAPLQTRINSFLQANASRRTITHLLEFLTTLLQQVDRGVGLTAVVLMAERLVNEREARAFSLDAAAAALGVLTEIRGQAQVERDRLAQFATRCHAVATQLGALKTTAQARLAVHPYADISLTEDHLLEQLRDRVQLTPPSRNLAQLLRLDEAQLLRDWQGEWLAQVQQQTAALSLIELMELEAAALTARADQAEPERDLVAATLETAYRRAGGRVLDTDRRATPTEYWLVGVPDETNAGFAFEGATLVGTGRRDQVQFVHVEVGLTLADLTAYTATRESFEQAAAHRNYFVLESLATDDHARQVFALSLAAGVIGVRGGVFAIDGEERVALGPTADEALDQFAQRPDWIKAAEDQVNALPLPVALERLEAYLARGRGIQDELWWEFASYVRERVALLKHQHVFVGEDVRRQDALAERSAEGMAPAGGG